MICERSSEFDFKVSDLEIRIVFGMKGNSIMLNYIGNELSHFLCVGQRSSAPCLDLYLRRENSFILFNVFKEMLGNFDLELLVIDLLSEV